MYEEGLLCHPVGLPARPDKLTRVPSRRIKVAAGLKPTYPCNKPWKCFAIPNVSIPSINVPVTIVPNPVIVKNGQQAVAGAEITAWRRLKVS
jgi:hypothetical protein